MMTAFIRNALLACVILVAGCSARPAVYQEQLLVFGTLVDVQLWGVSEAKAQRVVSRLAEDFEYMHRT